MITIVGGTYREVCFEPYWDETYGSGLRACLSLLFSDKEQEISFHTFCDSTNLEYLKSLEAQFPSLTVNQSQVRASPVFQYDHPLATPRIYPRPDIISINSSSLQAEGEKIIYYGMIDGGASVKGTMVVYDPQSPANPVSFSETGSSAESLAIIVNYTEAKLLSGSREVSDIRRFFFEKENVDVLILKLGPKGAIVFTGSGGEYRIPVFKTKSVWPIGSGDVFTAVFADSWFKGTPANEAALKASLATAAYCSTKVLQFSASATDLQPLTIESYPQATVYLAGPFFTFAERWLVDQIKSALQGVGLNVFSPFHDVGHGLAKDVVEKDIEGLENAGLVFAILDGLDSGTLFEIGYAVARKIPVIAYVQNEGEESVKMLEGTNCFLEKDLTTAIYRSLWILSGHA